MKKPIASFLIGLLSFPACYFVVWTFIHQVFKDKRFVDGVAASWTSPQGLYPYTDYTLRIQGRKKAYEIEISRVGNEGSYGHRFPIAFYYAAKDKEDMKKYIGTTHVQWNKEGVAIQTPVGHKIFIPSQSFLGGR